MSRSASRCFAYVRVSTAKQEHHGVSLEAQRDAIERYASRNGIEVAAWFTESQTAAKRGRPEFTRMLRLLRQGKAAGVIVHKIDRSARNLRDWADFAELVDRGLSIHLASEALDLTSRGGRLSADIQAVVAADYIRNLREEARKGFYGRLKQGVLPLPAPVGYLDRGKGRPKAVDPDKGPLVRELFERYATGRYSLGRLAAAMAARGLTNKIGRPLNKNGVARILANPFYVGLIEIKKTNEVFEGAHEPLVAKALYDRVQAVLSGKAHLKRHRHPFIFRRLATCGHCGGPLVGERQKGHVYYRCHARGCSTCTREERLNACVRTALGGVTLTEAERDDCFAALDWLVGAQHAAHEDVLARLRFDAGKAADRLSRLTDLLVDGVVDPATFEAKKGTLLHEKLGLDEKIAALENDPAWLREKVRRYLELATTASLSYEAANQERKRQMVEIVTSNLTVRGKEASVELREPFRLLSERHSVSPSAPSRDVLRTFSELLVQLSPSLEICQAPQPTGVQVMVARLALYCKEAEDAGSDEE